MAGNNTIKGTSWKLVTLLVGNLCWELGGEMIIGKMVSLQITH